MSRGHVAPTPAREVESLKKRVTDLERVLRSYGKRERDEIEFSVAGKVSVSESVPWTSRIERRVAGLVFLLGTAGSTSTTIEVRVNGTAFSTFIMPAGETLRLVTVSKMLAPDQDIVTAAVTAAGTGAVDLTVLVRFA